MMLLGLTGDARAQHWLLKSCATRLRLFYARRLSGSPSDVEDLVQETLIALHTRRASYDPARPFTAWLNAIARYKLADHFRAYYRRRSVSLGEFDCDMFADEAGDIGAPRDVDMLLAELPPKQQDAIRLTKIEGLSVAEAAKRTGQSPSGIKIGVHRGLKAMARRVKDMDE